MYYFTGAVGQKSSSASLSPFFQDLSWTAIKMLARAGVSSEAQVGKCRLLHEVGMTRDSAFQGCGENFISSYLEGPQTVHVLSVLDNGVPHSSA